MYLRWTESYTSEVRSSNKGKRLAEAVAQKAEQFNLVYPVIRFKVRITLENKLIRLNRLPSMTE